jgi:hypothetical protein
MKLSDEAKSALINTGSNRVGAHVPTNIAAGVDVDNELYGEKLISVSGCLTRKGSIERQRVVSAAEDAAFS